MSLRQKAIEGVFWAAVQNWGSSLFSVVTFFFLANLLDAEAFGLVALASVFTAFLAVLQQQGFAQAIVQRAKLAPGHLDTAFWISVVGGLLLAAVMFASAGLIARIWGQPPLAPVLRWLSVTILIGALGTVPRAMLRRNLAFKNLAFQSLIGSLTGGVVGVGMAISGFGVWSLVGQRLAASVTGTAAVWVSSRWRPGRQVSAEHFRDLFGFGVYIFGNQIVGFFNLRAADLLIGTFLGAKALGYYTVGHRLLLIMIRLFTQTVSTVALPTLSRLQHDPARMRQALLTATRMVSLLAFPAFLGAAVLAPELVHVLFGEKWDQSIPIMQILAFIGILRSVNFFNTPVILACGKPSWVFVLMLIHTVVNVAAIIIAVRWGIVAVAAAYVIRAYLLSPLPLWAMRKLIQLNPITYLRQFAGPLAASLVMAAAVLAVKQASAGSMSLPAVLCVSIIVGVAVYVAVVRVFLPALLREALELGRSIIPHRAGTQG